MGCPHNSQKQTCVYLYFGDKYVPRSELSLTKPPQNLFGCHPHLQKWYTNKVNKFENAEYFLLGLMLDYI